MDPFSPFKNLDIPLYRLKFHPNHSLSPKEVENSDSKMESKLKLTVGKFYMFLTLTGALGFSISGCQIGTLELSFFLTLAQEVKRSWRAINSSSVLKL